MHVVEFYKEENESLKHCKKLFNKLSVAKSFLSKIPEHLQITVPNDLERIGREIIVPRTTIDTFKTLKI